MSRECTAEGGKNDRGDKRGPIKCYKCQGEGHMAR